MKVKVTEQGVNVPRRMLEGIEEVEIRQEDGKVVIVPLPREDPIVGLGEDPVACNAPDASEKHDRYLYGSTE